jgi:hypothetical protein
MIKFTPLLIIVLLTVTIVPKSAGQDGPPVKWNFKTELSSKREIILTTTANIAPGWHLYSQYLKEGGPQPTRFSFYQSDAYTPVGQDAEKGEETTFYDEIYEMEITWYSRTVSFVQKFRLNEPVTAINGKVEYMTCNDHICIPAKKEFTVSVNMLKQDP